MPENEVPHGCCHCGCGGKTSIAKRTTTRYGHVKGKPLRFIPGHENRNRLQGSLEDRFFAKIVKGTGDACWQWTGAQSLLGYGRFHTLQGTRQAHRLSYELHYGPIPEGAGVLHRCDNPACVRPDHLFLGDQKANVQDMMNKGRGQVGETHYATKLLDHQVIEIRRRYASGKITRAELAQEYGTTQNAVRLLTLRQSWRHIP